MKTESTKQYLTAAQASAELGIARETLYAYVSRGWIRSEATAGPSRARRYRASDVAALKRRKTLRRHPEEAARAALHFGDSVLDSGITLIDSGNLYYRGEDAIVLATTYDFEDVAALLWNVPNTDGQLFDGADDNSEDDTIERHLQAVRSAADVGHSELSPLEVLQLLLPLDAASHLPAYNLTRDAVARTGVRLLHCMCTAATGAWPRYSIAESLQRAWLPDAVDATRIFNSVLILCADHELNVSTFAARCVASAGAPPHAAVQAGVAAMQGPRHGGASRRVEAFFDEARDDPERVVHDRLRRGETLPGFAHPLYPGGDPRGACVMELVAKTLAEHAAAQRALKIAAIVEASVGLRPNIDFGLVTVAEALELPRGTALTLFSLGRIAGWVAHIMEQYDAGRMIRPRARYIGPSPAVSSS